MNDIVYKIVFRRMSGALKSYAAYGMANVEYKVGEFVEAPEWLKECGYHLLVFDTLEQAKNFRPRFDINTEIEIWEAEAEDRITVLPPMLHIIELKNGEFFPHMNGNWPWGTMMYKRVKLLKKVS